MDSQSPQTELAACPFCGDGEELRIEADNACKCPCYFWVVCGSCGGRMVAEGERGAIAAWNTRPSPLVDTAGALRADIRDGAQHRIDEVAALSPTELLVKCNYFAGVKFAVHDEESAHAPCYVVQPGGAMIELNHWGDELTDVARAVFITRACNAALAAHPKPEVPRAASASDIAKLLDDPRIKAAVRVSGECPDCLRKADRCTCPKPEESN